MCVRKLPEARKQLLKRRMQNNSWHLRGVGNRSRVPQPEWKDPLGHKPHVEVPKRHYSVVRLNEPGLRPV